MAQPPTTRRIAIALFPGVQSLDVTGPLEVFSGAAQLLGGAPATEREIVRVEDIQRAREAPAPRETAALDAPAAYEVCTLSVDGRPLRTSSGLTIVPDGRFDQVSRELDTLIVPGGSGTRTAIRDEALLRWVARTSARARRTASVCTGAFLLAAAGLLDGRRATTHWAAADSLARRHPKVHVDSDPIYIRDGELWTSAGVSAGMDLSLALVEDDHDRELALAIARHLVLFLRRPGNQSQFSATLAAQQPAREPLREVQRGVVEDVAGDHSVEAMAARAHMSPRHFARAFRAETGITPARYVERVRLEAARRALEDGQEALASIAAACGFGTAETMRRVFLRALAVGPAEYRRRFQVSRVRREGVAHARTRGNHQSIIKKETSR